MLFCRPLYLDFDVSHAEAVGGLELLYIGTDVFFRRLGQIHFYVPNIYQRIQSSLLRVVLVHGITSTNIYTKIWTFIRLQLPAPVASRSIDSHLSAF